MGHNYLIEPAIFERMFRVIHGHLLLNNFANPHKSCTFFSVIGASILNVAHNVPGHSVSGAAVFDLGLGQPIAFSDASSKTITHSENGFHSWIEADGWFIDLTSPLYPDMVAELNLGKCNRLMFQKPLSEEAPSLAELSAKHRFCLFPDQEFTSQRIDFVLEDDTFLEITHIRAYHAQKTQHASELQNQTSVYEVMASEEKKRHDNFTKPIKYDNRGIV